MNNESRLDAKDFKILVELDKDARQSNNQIGKKVGLSKEVVKYRIDGMIKNGTIIRFHTIVNYFKLGIIKLKLYLRLTDVNKNKLEEIAEYFNKHEKTEWVALTTGRWDLIVGFLVNNVNEFDDEVQLALNKFSRFIQEKAVTTTLYLSHNTREFLDKPGKRAIRRIVYHTTKDLQEEIDLIDREILKIITNNAQIPIIEIAQKLKTTPRIVQYRLKEMEKRNIILAYRVHIDPKMIGRIFSKALIYLTNTTKDRVNEFVSYASSIPGAVWPQRILGNWDFELDFELESYDVFQETIMKLKEKFPDIIKNHEFCITSKEFKLDLFPGALPTFIEVNKK